MKSVTYDKPFKTYEELIQIMRSRNIIVQNKDFAMQVLENMSYYGLINGYKDSFLQIPGSDLFIPGTRFEELYTLHIIDTALNNILFKYILYLEKALKSRISYLVANKYGVYTDYSNLTFLNPKDYLCQNYYSNSLNRRINTLIRLKEHVSSVNHNPMMLHYLNSKNHVPPWILTTNISYGLTIEWYNILTSEDREKICRTFISSQACSIGQVKEFVKKSFEITKEYRNRIAHGNRTFSISSLPQLPKKQLLTFSFHAVSIKEYNHRMGQNDAFAVILALLIMLNDRYLSNNLRTELFNIFSPYRGTLFNQKTIFEVFGFPNDLFNRLDHLIRNKFL